jgi:hypothetical protein
MTNPNNVEPSSRKKSSREYEEMEQPNKSKNGRKNGSSTSSNHERHKSRKKSNVKYKELDLQKQQCQQSIQNTSPSIQKTLMTTLSVFQILFGLITSFTQLFLMYSGISLPYTNFNHNNFGMYCLISSFIGLASVMYGFMNLSVSKKDQLSEKEVKMNVFGGDAMNIFFMTLAVIGIVLMLVFEMESSVYKHGIIVLHLFILQTVLNFVCITCQCIFGCTLPCKITGSRPGSNSINKHLCKNCHQNCDHIHQHV